ncbi:MAG: hypothetical protein ACI8S6_000929 [Myxococcota bacterium]|jgi:hypothetical protein
MTTDATRELFSAIESGDLDRLEEALQHTSPDTTRSGQTPLHLAAQTDQPIAVEILLAAGVSPDKTDPNGATAAHLAAASGAVPILRALEERGADVERRDASGRRPRDCADNNPDVLLTYFDGLPLRQTYRKVREYMTDPDLLQKLERGSPPADSDSSQKKRPPQR